MSSLDHENNNQAYFDFAPWSMDSSLKEKTTEVGIDYDAFIDGQRTKSSDLELAREFAVSEETIRNLREHFETEIGLNCIMGH